MRRSTFGLWILAHVLIVIAILLSESGCVLPTPTSEPPTVTPPVSIPPSATPPRATSPFVPLVPATPTPVPPLPSNLSNGDFEGDFVCDGGATCVAEDWNYGFVNPPACDPDDEGCYITCPFNCLNERGKCGFDTGCYWMRPEFAWTNHAAYWYRVHSGTKAQRWFGWGRQEWGWIWRQAEVEPGKLYEFSAWFQAWMCTNPDLCLGGRLSDLPAKMHLRVGIDPTGGTDILSPDIVWTEIEAFDSWSRAGVMAVATGDTMTVFISSRADWTDRVWRISSDVYVDDANLRVIQSILYLPVVMRH